GERLAARYLRRQGLAIVSRNVRCGRGEIDLVALEGTTLVFVEVKSRTARPGEERTGLEKLGPEKLRALRRACHRYLKKARGPIEGYRLDAVTVEFEERGRRRVVREVRWHPAVGGWE
ncbi:MAG: YraN family protein, partial [Planctomycetes bacterium]|nr:YraN family protein [Planctomycetota bacterium]